MSDKNKYGTIINEKFSDFSFQDMDTTWLDMKDILDKEMPQSKRRRLLLWLNWYTGSALFLLSVSVIILVIFGYLHSNDNIAQSNTISDKNSTPVKPNISESTVIENNEIQSNEFQYSTDTKKRSISTDLVNTNPRIKKANAGNDKEYKIIPSNKNNSTADKTVSINKNNNNTAVQKTALNKNNLLNSFTTIDQSSNDRIVKNNSDKDASNKDVNVAYNKDVNVHYFDKLRNTPAVMLPERSNLSTRKYDVVGQSRKDQLNHLNLLSVTSSNTNDSALVVASKVAGKNKGKGWVVGAAVNYNFPVSNQEMSTVNMNGKNNTLIDFLPSVYAQYHFNQKLHIESSFQFTSPQYISNHKLAAVFKDLDPAKKEENAIWLNKLYYLNLPVSVHYKVLPNLTVGTGIQYSYLRRSIMADEIAIWEKQGTDWIKTSSETSIKVKSNSEVKKEKANNGNGNGGNGNGNGNGGNGNGNGNGGNGNGNGNGNGGNGGSNPPPPPTPPVPMPRIDTVAQTLRSSDLRLLFDVNYSLKRLNMGIRYQFGLNNYINTKSGGYVLPVKDRNQALQLYMRYDIFDKRKKK